MNESADALPTETMTVEEFASWSSGTDGRFELIDGRVVRMQSELRIHSVAKVRVANVLQEAIERAGLDCRALVDGPMVTVDDDQSFVPDASVECGPEGAGLYNENPVVVVEVLSPGSQGIDYGDKLQRYFRNPLVFHYLVVDPQKRTTTHFRRVGDNAEVSIGAQRIIRLEPPGLSVDTEAFFPLTVD